MAWHTETDTRHEIRAATLVLVHCSAVLLAGGLGGGLPLHPALVESFWVACLLLWGHSLRVGLSLAFCIVQVAALTESGIYFYLLPAAALATTSVLITGKVQKDHLSVPLAFALLWMALTALVGWFYEVTNSRMAVPHYSTSELLLLVFATFAQHGMVKRLTLPVTKEIV